MKTRHSSVITIAVLFLSSCEIGTTSAPCEISTTSAPASLSEAEMTLQEFAQSRTLEYEATFFANTPISDNNADWTDITTVNTRPYFRWPVPERGCRGQQGICSVIPMGKAVDPDVPEVPTVVNRGKLVLKFRDSSTENHGVTSDGYMPIIFDVEVPASSRQDLGLTTQTKIKAGIYKAHYDAAKRKHTGVVLDLI